MNKIKEIIKICKNNYLILSFAESITGGYLASQITKHPGASNILKGSIITYSSTEKIKKLNVNPTTIEKFAVVSKEVAKEMNDGLNILFPADITVSITGNAGPTFEINTNKFQSFVCIKFRSNYFEYQLDYKYMNRIKLFNKLSNFIFNEIYLILKTVYD